MSASVPKNIIILLDGTWNDSDYGTADTNIVRLRERISKAMQNSGSNIQAADVAAGHIEGIKNIVFYQRGLGTNTVDKMRGGIFGAGLNQNVRNAYRFICANYVPNDRIFIFGFSRGAFTARSLAGFIAAAGILKAGCCIPANESRAWYYYRTRPAERFSGVAEKLKDHVHRALETPITCLGVFDTVGSLGAPLQRFSKLNRRLYEFHDVFLSNVAKVNLHAMAIDEHRWPFEATLWRRPKFTRFENTSEQVWFAGSHADVGGGNVDETSRGDELDELPLDWMLKRLNTLPDTKDFFPVKPRGFQTEAAVKANQTNSRRGIYRFYRFANRCIGDIKAATRLRHDVVGYDRHNKPQDERIHRSAIERLGIPDALIEGRQESYLPENLIAYLKAYIDHPELRIPIVDWNGEVCEATEALDLVTNAVLRAQQ